MFLSLCLSKNTHLLSVTRTSRHESASLLWWVKCCLPADLSASLPPPSHWGIPSFQVPCPFPPAPGSPCWCLCRHTANLGQELIFFLLCEIRFEKQFARADASCRKYHMFRLEAFLKHALLVTHIGETDYRWFQSAASPSGWHRALRLSDGADSVQAAALREAGVQPLLQL